MNNNSDERKMNFNKLLLIFGCSMFITSHIHSYQRIYQLAGDDFYTYSSAKQCFVPVNYSELGAEWYMHPEQLCLEDSDAKQLMPIQLSGYNSKPITCPPDRKHIHHFSTCCALSCCQERIVDMRLDNPLQGLINRYYAQNWD